MEKRLTLHAKQQEEKQKHGCNKALQDLKLKLKVMDLLTCLITGG